MSIDTFYIFIYFNFQNLLKAYYDCRQRKRKTANAVKVEINFEKKLLKLELELKNHTYKPGKSICFIVIKPKKREIFAADFCDRIVHHLLINYLEPIWEKKFIFHSFACRKNKGAHLAIKFLKKFVRVSTKNFSCPAYYLQVDISAFFMSLNKKILYEKIARHTKNSEILWLTKKIIFHNPTENFYYKGDLNLIKLIPPHKSLFTVSKEQGLPIGNLTSQFFANIYLDSLDQFIKHKLKVKYYLRYVDDFILIDKNQKNLLLWKKQIDSFLAQELKLKLHPKKSVLQSVYKSINFVGFIVKPTHSLIRKRTVANLKEKLKEFNFSSLPNSSKDFQNRLEKISSTINSYYGQFKHADTTRLRKSLYVKHFGILKTYLNPSDQNFLSFRIKNLTKPRLSVNNCQRATLHTEL